MTNLTLLIKNNLIALIRTKKAFILLIVFILCAMLSPLLAHETKNLLMLAGEEFQAIKDIIPDPVIADSFIQLNKNLTQIGLLVVVFSLASMINNEFKKGTYLTLKMHKVSLNCFYLAHLISQLIVFTIIYIISSLIFILYTYLLFNQESLQGFSQALLALYLLFVFIIVLFNSLAMFFKSNAKTYIITLIIYFFLPLFGFIKQIKYYLPTTLNDQSIQLVQTLKANHLNECLIATSVLIIVLITLTLIFNQDRIDNQK